MEFADKINLDNLSRKERLRIAGVRTILEGLVVEPVPDVAGLDAPAESPKTLGFNIAGDYVDL